MSQQNLDKNFTDDEHLLTIDKLCSRLNTDSYYGLTWRYARNLLKKEGSNKYTRPSQVASVPLRKRLFKGKSDQYWSKRDWNRVFNTQLDSEYTTIRDGQKCLVKRKELVPGDLVYLRSGHVVPADMRVISYHGELIVDNRIITGNPAELKSNSPTSSDSLLSQNVIFASTVITNGSCEGIVLKTGDDTVFAELTQFATKVKLFPRPHSLSVSSTCSSETSLSTSPHSLPSSLSLISDSSLSDGISTMSL